jgi:hypothetical protein
MSLVVAHLALLRLPCLPVTHNIFRATVCSELLSTKRTSDITLTIVASLAGASRHIWLEFNAHAIPVNHCTTVVVPPHLILMYPWMFLFYLGRGIEVIAIIVYLWTLLGWHFLP